MESSFNTNQLFNLFYTSMGTLENDIKENKYGLDDIGRSYIVLNSENKYEMVHTTTRPENSLVVPKRIIRGLISKYKNVHRGSIFKTRENILSKIEKNNETLLHKKIDKTFYNLLNKEKALKARADIQLSNTEIQNFQNSQKSKIKELLENTTVFNTRFGKTSERDKNELTTVLYYLFNENKGIYQKIDEIEDLHEFKEILNVFCLAISDHKIGSPDSLFGQEIMSSVSSIKFQSFFEKISSEINNATSVETAKESNTIEEFLALLKMIDQIFNPVNN